MIQEDKADGLINIQMAAYEPPSIQEKKRQKVVWFGEDNMFPFDLVELYNNSPTHNSIVNGKVGYICGRGFKFEDESVEKKTAVRQFLHSANPNENWNQLVKKLATDYEVHNCYAIEVIRNQGGLEFHHMDASRVRRSTDPNMILYSDKWKKGKMDDGSWIRHNKPESISIPLYRKESTDKRSVILHSDYRPDMDWYPLPTYQGSLAAINTDIEINHYWYNEVRNGFSGGTMLSLNNGVPKTKEEEKKVEKKFQKKFGGSRNAGKTVITFAVDKEHEPTILNLNGNDLDKRYAQMALAVQQNIFIGHRVTSPMLFGVKTEGQLGGRDEIQTAYEMFKKTYIEERQQTIERTANKLCAIVTGYTGIELQGFEPVDMGFVVDANTIVANLEKQEIRDLIAKQTGMDLKKAEGMKKFNSAEAEEKAVLELFEKYGSEKSSFEVLAAFDIDFDLDGNPKGFKFAEELAEMEMDVLKTIRDNGGLTTIEIATILGGDVLEIQNVIAAVQSQGMISKVDGNWLILPNGAKTLQTEGLPPKEQLRIRYEYTLRDDAPPLKTGSKSRNFCRALMSMDRLWSREQIDLMRNDMKESGFADVTNVWLARGGWYRAPGTEVAKPFCRHTWKQIVTIEK